MTELELQTKCFQWAWNSYPDLRYLFFHVPNGGYRNKIEAMQLKSSGVVAGIPDIILTNPILPVLGIELKTTHGKQSDQQTKVQHVWGKNYKICRDFETFKNIFKEYYNVHTRDC